MDGGDILLEGTDPVTAVDVAEDVNVVHGRVEMWVLHELGEDERVGLLGLVGHAVVRVGRTEFDVVADGGAGAGGVAGIVGGQTEIGQGAGAQGGEDEGASVHGEFSFLRMLVGIVFGKVNVCYCE